MTPSIHSSGTPRWAASPTRFETHWDGLYLVPANLKLYSAEYELAARIARTEPALLNRLAEGIASIGDQLDVVILDPPPALGTISLSVMRAANALLIPIPPTVVDFTSTGFVSGDAVPRDYADSG